MNIRPVAPVALGLAVALGTSCQDFPLSLYDETGWVELFNGEDLTGWRASENVESWRVSDGVLVANGPRSHLFYVGDEEPFTDFILEAEVMTKPNSNSGVYFHTAFQEAGWPKYGFEVQVNNSYDDRNKTGSLYAVAINEVAPVEDDEWFTLRISVRGKHVLVEVNDEDVTDYTEPRGTEPGEDFTRVFDKGTFALQAHDPGSTVMFRRIRVKRL